VGNVPAYRGTAYVVIWGLQLADYGNRLPNLEFLVEADEEISGRRGARSISSAVRDRSEHDLGVGDRPIRCAVIRSPSRARAPARCSRSPWPMISTACSIAGGLRFIPAARGIAGIVPNYFLAGHQGGDQRPELIHWTRDAETNLPQQATIAFADPDRDYQVNAQVARRVAGSAQNNLQPRCRSCSTCRTPPSWSIACSGKSGTAATPRPFRRRRSADLDRARPGLSLRPRPAASSRCASRPSSAARTA
jgi:hypothetical protein